MKKKIIITTFTLCFIALVNLGAVSIDEIINGAKENSPSYQNTLISYQKNLLSLSNLEEEDKSSISLDVTANPLSELNEKGETPDSKEETGDGISLGSNLSLTLPNDGNTTISAEANISTRYDNKKTAISGSLGASHTFDFSSYDEDKIDDLTYTKTKYSTESSFKEAELKFEKTVIETVSSILTQEKQIKTLESDYNTQKKTVDKITALATYSETSTVFVNAKNLLSQKEATLNSTKEQYNNLLSSYKSLTGLEWSGLDELTEPVLNLTTYDGGNTEVLLSSLNAELQEENYKKLLSEENPSKLSTSINAKVSNSRTVTLSGSATYFAKNWSVSLSPGLSITKSGETTPSLTIKGSWNNGGSSKSQTEYGQSETVDEDDVKAALYSVQSANNDYLSALSSYNENVQAYALKIIEWNNKKDSSKAELSYLESVKESQEELFNLGLITQDDLDTATLNLETAKLDWAILLLEGMSLERDLEIFAL